MAERKRPAKTDRQRRKRKSAIGGNPNSYKHLYQGGASQTLATSQEPVTTTAATGKGTETVDWQNEYSYVIRDLSLLFVVSILIFAGMIVSGYLF